MISLQHRPSEVAFPNGIKSSFSYMPGKIAHLSKIRHIGSSGDISSFSYDYDLNDNITALSTTRSEITVNSALSYNYDVLNQIILATKPQGTGNETFSYDAVGNRLKRDGETVSSTFNDGNQLTNDKTYSYIYDKMGTCLKELT